VYLIYFGLCLGGFVYFTDIFWSLIGGFCVFLSDSAQKSDSASPSFATLVGLQACGRLPIRF
jgi:hypothetical protein